MEHLGWQFDSCQISFLLHLALFALVSMEFIGGGHISFSYNSASLNCSLVDAKNVL